MTQRVWYAAYGSNTDAARFACYLQGGCPEGGGRHHPGCRDPGAPIDTRALWLPGSVYFAGASKMWTGGMAFYDPATPGPVAARGWLITVQQLADLITQEMHEAPGTRPELEKLVSEVLGHGTEGSYRLGPGHYETLLTTHALDGTLVATFTSATPHPEAERTRPSARYLATIAAGLDQIGHERRLRDANV